MNEQTKQPQKDDATKNKPQEQKPALAVPTPVKAPASGDGAPASAPKNDLSDTSQDEGEVRPKTAGDSSKVTPTNQQTQQPMPGTDAAVGKWKQHLGSAKIAWSKLTEDELLKSDGQSDKLAGLVQERYAIGRDTAEKQVKNFFEQHKVSSAA